MSTQLACVNIAAVIMGGIVICTWIGGLHEVQRLRAENNTLREVQRKISDFFDVNK